MRCYALATMAAHPLALVLALTLMVACIGCASTSPTETAPAPSAGATPMVWVYLKTGPMSASQTPESSQENFKGHMANMKRLAEQRKLLVAGPFDHPKDSTWRGIFLFDVPTVDDAKALVATDPGVIAEVFATELHPVIAPAALRDAYENEQRLLARTDADTPRDPGSPPPNIRAYVMVTASNGAQAALAIRQSPWRDKVLFAVRLTDSPGAIFVLDAPAKEDVAASLTPEAIGGGSIDSWWSTASLVDLPNKAGSLP